MLCLFLLLLHCFFVQHMANRICIVMNLRLSNTTINSKKHLLSVRPKRLTRRRQLRAAVDGCIHVMLFKRRYHCSEGFDFLYEFRTDMLCLFPLLLLPVPGVFVECLCMGTYSVLIFGMYWSVMC